MKYKISGLAVALFFFILLPVVFYQNSQNKKVKNTLRISLPSDVSSLHLAFNHSSSIINSSHVMNFLFEGLMRRNKDDFPETALAETVKVSEDNKRYTFLLREAKWSDGNPVTAYDFEYAWKRAIDPLSKVLTISPYYFYPIKNAKLCMEGSLPIDEVGIKAVDPKTLVVDLEYPSPFFLEIISSPMFFPAPKHVAHKNPLWALGPKLVCNGPFVLDTWQHNKGLELSKNLQYWDAGHVYLDHVDIAIISDSRTALNLFINKQLDWIGSPFYGISYDISYDVINDYFEDSVVTCILTNTEKFPLNNKKIRQALAYSINRESITHNVFYDSATPSTSVLPIPIRIKKDPCFQENERLAREIFLEALEELNLTPENFPPLELNYLANIEMASRIAQAIQDQWRKVLGVKNISLVAHEYNAYFDLLTRRNYSLGLTNWTCFAFDPIFILNDFRYKSILMNKTNWESPYYQKLLDQADQALEKTARKEFLVNAESLLMEEMPIIPICSLKKRFAKNPNLQGEVLSRLQFVDFKSAYFENQQKPIKRLK